MTRPVIAALFDVHGNLPALEAVLRHAATVGAHRVVLGGDVVDGPLPRATLDRLLRLVPPPLFVRGNTERAVAAAAAPQRGVEPGRPTALQRWVAEQLSPDHLRFLAGLPRCALVTYSGRTVLLCHATPRSDREVFTPATPAGRLRSIFEQASADAVLCGHTHLQFAVQVGRLQVVNGGSVGMPTGGATAQWALLGDSIELMRTPYDLGAAAVAIAASGYPAASTFIQENLVRPHDVESSIAYFEARAAADPAAGAEPPGWG